MKTTGLRKFILDESGQTTTEYILILAVVVTLIMQFKKNFTRLLQKMLGNLEQQIDEDIFEE